MQPGTFILDGLVLRKTPVSGGYHLRCRSVTVFAPAAEKVQVYAKLDAGLAAIAAGEVAADDLARTRPRATASAR